jgi:thiamine biosynthesis lipoprotein
MGMEVRVVLHAASAVQARAAAAAAFAEIARLDGLLSDYRADSVVRRIARVAPDPVEVDADVLAVLAAARDLARDSGGAFDPTVAPVVALWREARSQHRLPDAERLADARTLVDWRRLQIDDDAHLVRLASAGMHLDVGGIAKGFILQRALRKAHDRGVSRMMIEAGGDIVAGDPPPGTAGWRVQMRCGTDDRVVAIANEAVSTSGASAQFLEVDGVRYSHVIDPRTGTALTSHHTVHVRARDAMLADGWATALGVIGPAGVDAVDLPLGLTYCFEGVHHGAMEDIEKTQPGVVLSTSPR